MRDFQAMRAFASVAELGSFTRAADALGLSRAMVSTHVQRLEQRFGLRLLNRTTRKVAVTPAGSDYLEHCRRVFAELDAAEETLRQSKERPTGRLRVDVAGSFARHLLLPALPTFLARYPGRGRWRRGRCARPRPSGRAGTRKRRAPGRGARRLACARPRSAGLARCIRPAPSGAARP